MAEEYDPQQTEDYADLPTMTRADFERYSQPASEDETEIPAQAQYTAGRLPEGELPTMTRAEFARASQAPAAQTDGQLPTMTRAEFEQQSKASEPEGAFATGVRHFVHALPALATGVGAGALYGAVGGPGGMIGGAIAGGGAALLESYGQSKATQALFPEEAERLRAGEEAHPIASTVGEVAAVAPYFGVGGLSKAALKASVGQRAVNAVLTGGMDVGTQLATTGTVDPTQAAIQTAGGAVFGGAPTALGRGVIGSAEQLGARLRLGQPVPHGTPGAETAAGTAQEAKPTAEPAPTEYTPVRAAKPGPEDYSKQAPTEPGAATGVNVGPDPTLAHVFEQSTPELDAAVRRATAAEVPPAAAARPDETVRGPAPATRAAGVEPEATTRPPPATPREAIEQRASGQTVGDVLRARLDQAVDAPNPAAHLRETAAFAREQGQPWRAREIERAADAVEGSRMQQQQQEQRPGAVPSPTGGGQVPPPRPPSGADVAAGAPMPPEPPAIGQQLTQGPKTIWDQLKNVFAPQTRGPLARQLADWVRGTYGESTQLHEQTKNILDQHTDTVRAMGQEDLRKLVNRAQGGNAFPDWQPNQAQQGLLTDIKRVTDMWASKLSTLDRAQQREWIENYLPGMYKNPKANPQFFQDFGRGMGGAGSLKAKTFPDYEAARAVGLEPYTNDPIHMMELYGEKMRNFIGRQEALEKGLKSGLFIESKPPERIGAAGSPEPQIKTNLPPNYVESKTTRGLYMPEEVRAAWDNFHSAGLRGGGQKDLYGALRTANSAWTNLELSFNGYHAFTMANEGIISDVAMALEKLAGGNITGGLKTLAQAPLAPVTRARLGSRVQQSYLDPRSTDPITQVLTQVGFRPIGRSHAQDSMLAQKTFLNSFKDMPKQLQQAMQESRQDWTDAKGNILQQVAYPFKLAQRAIATVSHPLFEVYIPKLKAGAAYAQMEHWRGANPDKIGSAEETAAARKIVDSIDNRFGEMITDHLFMNKVVQDMGVAGMRSFSWFMGSMKEIGGGAYSGARAVTRAAIERDPSRLNVLNPANPHYDPRVAYAIAMPMTIAATSAMYQYFLGSKDAPASWRDLYAPRTGGILPRGVQEHMLMPGYHKDVYGWLAHPGVEAYNKFGGVWTTAIEEARGRGSPAIGSPPFIRPDATFTQNVTDRMNYFLSKLGPIGAKAFVKGQKEGSKIPDVLTAAGFHPPGMEIQAPEAISKIKGKQEKIEWKTMTKRANRDAISRGQPIPYPTVSPE